MRVFLAENDVYGLGQAPEPRLIQAKIVRKVQDYEVAAPGVTVVVESLVTGKKASGVTGADGTAKIDINAIEAQYNEPLSVYPSAFLKSFIPPSAVVTYKKGWIWDSPSNTPVFVLSEKELVPRSMIYMGVGAVMVAAGQSFLKQDDQLQRASLYLGLGIAGYGALKYFEVI